MEDGLQDWVHPPVVFLLSGVSHLKKSRDTRLFLNLKITKLSCNTCDHRLLCMIWINGKAPEEVEGFSARAEKYY